MHAAFFFSFHVAYGPFSFVQYRVYFGGTEVDTAVKKITQGPFFFLILGLSTFNALLICMLPPRCDRRFSTPRNRQLGISVIPSNRLVTNPDSNRPANRVTYYHIPPVRRFNNPAADPPMNKALTPQGLVRQTPFEQSWILQI